MKKVEIIGDNAKVTMGNNSDIISYSEKEKTKINFFDQWFYKSISVALVFGLSMGIFLKSFTYGLLSTIILFGIIQFFNPIRRFFRLGISILLYALTYLTASSLHLEIKANYNEYINGFLNFHKEFSMLAFSLLLGVGVLCIILDYYIHKNKDSNK